MSAATRIKRDIPKLRLVYSAHGKIAQEERYGYGAATSRRRSGRAVPVGGSGDSHLLYDRDLLRRISQEHERDSTLASSLVTRAVDFWLGPGFELQPKTGNERLNTRIKEDWAAWGDNPESRELHDWYDLEYLAARHLAVDGDVGAYLPAEGDKFTFVEAERIRNPGGKPSGVRTTSNATRLIGGVEVDSVSGKPLRFHVGGFDDDGGGKTTAVDAAEFAFVAHVARHSMTRGVPVLCQSFSMLERISDVLNSEAECWQMLARMAFMLKRTNAAALSDATSADDDDAVTDEALARRVHDVGTALIFHGEPNETIEAVKRELPGANFPESVRTYCRLLGLVLGLPIELVLLDFSQGSFSSVRGALITAFRTFQRYQKLIKRGWHRPIYLWWLNQRIAQGIYPDRPTTRMHEWRTPRFPYLDPAKDAEAVGTQMDRGILTYDDALAEQGKSRTDLVARRKIEVDEAMALADELNAKFSDAIAGGRVQPVDWKMFAGLSAAGVATTVAQVTAKAESDSPPPAKTEGPPA